MSLTTPDAGRRRRRPRRILTGVGAVAAAGLVGVLASTATTSAPDATADAPGAPAGWTTVWTDDFAGSAGSLPSSANWQFDLGHGYPGAAENWGTGEIERMTADPANVSLDGGGNLRITPLRDSSGAWTSARIETRRTDFAPPAGGTVRIEGRLQLPDVTGAAAQGYWPAFWALGAPFRGVYTNWPAAGEIDVMENINGTNTVYGTLHCGVAPGGPCNENSGLGGNRSGFSPSLQAGFHTYAVEWDRSTSPEQIRWYVDGAQYHTVTKDTVGADTWAQATGHGFFVILNVAMGGGWPGSPTAATVPGKPMLVDYVTVRTRGGGSTPSTPPATSTPSTPTPSTSTPPTGGTRSAYSRIEAESFDGQQGVQVYATGDGGRKIGSIANGDLARFDRVDFGSRAAHRFVARVASGAPSGASGLVQVRLDSPTATPVGSFAVANTGGWTSYREIPGALTPVTGVHTVYLTFSSGQGAEYVDVDWLTFDNA